MAKSENSLFSAELVDMILQILKRGDTVELKRENGKLVVVEIRRKMKTKASFEG